jgi:exopolyphosphatase/guanosine-5'-triphosphate,3'-diphosphate pyrophosphatase
MIRAAIDIGTNSTRLLVVGHGGERLARRTITTRLGEGVDADRRLHPEAIARTCAALAEYRADGERLGVERWRAVATSAARDAANTEEFFDAAEAVLGTRPELLAGDREARLSFAGAAGGLDGDPGLVVVIDIGGGSTEFVLGRIDDDGPQVVGAISIDIGSVRLTERELHGDPPRPEELSNAIAVVQAHLDDVELALGDLEGFTFVGVAGTITTVAAIELGQVVYDRDAIHHFVLTRAAAEDVFRTLATEPLADRRHNPGLPAERADIIVGGCCILVAILRRWGASQLLVSETDILDGIVSSLT